MSIYDGNPSTSVLSDRILDPDISLFCDRREVERETHRTGVLAKCVCSPFLRMPANYTDGVCRRCRGAQHRPDAAHRGAARP